jgi:ankyrin repeat protein
VKDNIKITGLGYLRQYLIICLNGQIKCMKNLSVHKQIPDQESNAGHLGHGTNRWTATDEIHENNSSERMAKSAK